MTQTEFHLFEMALARVMEGTATPEEFAMFARICEMEVELKTLRDERRLILNRAEWLAEQFKQAQKLPEKLDWKDEPIDPGRMAMLLGFLAVCVVVVWWWVR